jgi:hypothetical protein
VTRPTSGNDALLATCARLTVPRELRGELACLASRIEDWDVLVHAAERHGLAPLLYAHHRSGSLPLPPRAASQVRALYLRHRRANAIRLQALSEILDAFGAADVSAWILKGPALIALVYGDPALRPMSDLDLLVDPADASRAQELLRELGYRAASVHARDFWRHHHLPPATGWRDGVLVQVELHLDALPADGRATLELGERRESPTVFAIDGRRVCTLGPHEFLWHLCEHLVGVLPCAMRLIGAADVVAYAGAFAERLDWDRMRRQQPIVASTLRFLDVQAPLAETVRSHLDLDRRGLDCEAGRRSADCSWSWVASTEPAGRFGRLRRALNPPAWWFALRYDARPDVRAQLTARLQYLPVAGRAVWRRGRLLVTRDTP